jgi:hypothetical protein
MRNGMIGPRETMGHTEHYRPDLRQGQGRVACSCMSSDRVKLELLKLAAKCCAKIFPHPIFTDPPHLAPRGQRSNVKRRRATFLRFSGAS